MLGSKHLCIDKPKSGKKIGEERQFENETEGKKKFGGELQIFTDTGQGPDTVTGKTYKELEAEGKHDKVTKESAPEEKNRGKQDDGKHGPLFSLVEAWGEETPELVNDYRRGKADAGEQGNLQIGDESLGEGSKNQPFSRGHHLNERSHQNLKYLFGEEIANEKTDSNGCKTDYKTVAQLFQMLGKRHLGAGIIVICRHGRISPGPELVTAGSPHLQYHRR